MFYDVDDDEQDDQDDSYAAYLKRKKKKPVVTEEPPVDPNDSYEEFRRSARQDSLATVRADKRAPKPPVTPPAEPARVPYAGVLSPLPGGAETRRDTVPMPTRGSRFDEPRGAVKRDALAPLSGRDGPSVLASLGRRDRGDEGFLGDVSEFAADRMGDAFAVGDIGLQVGKETLKHPIRTAKEMGVAAVTALPRAAMYTGQKILEATGRETPRERMTELPFGMGELDTSRMGAGEAAWAAVDFFGGTLPAKNLVEKGVKGISSRLAENAAYKTRIGEAMEGARGRAAAARETKARVGGRMLGPGQYEMPPAGYMTRDVPELDRSRLLPETTTPQAREGARQGPGIPARGFRELPETDPTRMLPESTTPMAREGRLQGPGIPSRGFREIPETDPTRLLPESTMPPARTTGRVQGPGIAQPAIGARDMASRVEEIKGWRDRHLATDSDIADYRLNRDRNAGTRRQILDENASAEEQAAERAAIQADARANAYRIPKEKRDYNLTHEDGKLVYARDKNGIRQNLGKVHDDGIFHEISELLDANGMENTAPHVMFANGGTADAAGRAAGGFDPVIVTKGGARNAAGRVKGRQAALERLEAEAKKRGFTDEQIDERVMARLHGDDSSFNPASFADEVVDDAAKEPKGGSNRPGYVVNGQLGLLAAPGAGAIAGGLAAPEGKKREGAVAGGVAALGLAALGARGMRNAAVRGAEQAATTARRAGLANEDEVVRRIMSVKGGPAAGAAERRVVDMNGKLHYLDETGDPVPLSADEAAAFRNRPRATAPKANADLPAVGGKRPFKQMETSGAAPALRARTGAIGDIEGAGLGKKKGSRKEYPLASDVVDGRTVGSEISNTSSISASLGDEHSIAKGVREVPLEDFETGKPKYYSTEQKERTLALVEEIKRSGRIDPLIVVRDADGPYILEGAHRFDALREMGAKSFPALVVDDTAARFKTGKAAKVPFLRNTEKAPDMGERFGQHIEPSGRYVVEREAGVNPLPGWESGEVDFKNPLVVDFGGDYRDPSNWKAKLSAQFGGKKGKALSDAIREAGHDGIITMSGDETREIVDLTQRSLEDRIAARRKAYTELREPRMSGLHNLSPDNLASADRLGGMPVPSIAVVPESQPFDQYGSITMIGKKSVFDPAGNPVFDTDAYTGRVPAPEYKAASWDKVKKAFGPMKESFQKSGFNMDWEQVTHYALNGEPDRAFDYMRRSPGARAHYLSTVGETVDPVMVPARIQYGGVADHPAVMKFVTENPDALNARPGDDLWKQYSAVVTQAIDELPKKKRAAARKQLLDPDDGELSFGYGDRLAREVPKVGTKEVDKYATEESIAEKMKAREGDYEKWVRKQMEPFFENPRVTVGRRKVPFTLDNVVEASVRDRIAGAEKTMTFGPGQARANTSHRFSSMDEMKNTAEAPWGIKDPETVAALEKDFGERSKAWRSRILEHGGGDTWDDLDSMHKGLAAYLKRAPTPKNQARIFRQEMARFGFKGMPDDLVEESIALAKEIREMPRDYFEAKPQRGVGFDEFPGAVIPDDAPEHVREILDRRGVRYEEYPKGDSTARNAAVARLRKALFEEGHETLGAMAPVAALAADDEEDDSGQSNGISNKAIITALGFGVAGLIAGRKMARATKPAKDLESAIRTAGRTLDRDITPQMRVNMETPGPRVDRLTPKPAPKVPAGDVDPNEFVNLKKFALDEHGEERLASQVQRVVAENKLAPKQKITWEQTKDIAKSMGLQPNQLIVGKDRLSGPEMLAIRNIVKENTEKVVELETRLATDGSLSDDQRKVIERALAGIDGQSDALLGRFVKERSRTGRDLNNLKILAQTSNDPVVWLARAKRVLGEAPLTDEIRSEIVRLTNAGDAAALAKYTAELQPSSNWEKIRTFWQAGLLTGPKTHMANFVGNTTMAMLERAKDAPAFVLDRLLGTVTGMQTKAFSLSGMSEAAAEGAKKGIKQAKRVLKGEVSGDLSRLNVRETNYDNAILNAYTRAPFRALGASDQVFRQVALSQSLDEQARVMARAEGWRGDALKSRIKALKDQPTDEMAVRALEAAEYATFQDNSPLAKAALGLRRSLGPVGEVIIPFAKTPGNVAMRTFEYTPAGALLTIPDLVKLLQGAGTSEMQRNVVEKIGRSSIGAAALYAGYELADRGLWSGGYTTDAAKREEKNLEGKPNNAVKIGDRWYSLTRVSPLGNLIAVGASLHEIADKADASVADKAVGTVASVAKSVADQSFLTGLTSAVDAIKQPAEYGTQYLRQLGVSIVPAAVQGAVRAIEPTVRDERGATVGEAAAERAGIGRDLPPRRNVFGETVTREGGLRELFDPTDSRRDATVDDPVIREIARVKAELGPVSKISGEDSKAYSARLGSEGPAIRRVLEHLFATPGYQQLEKVAEQAASENGGDARQIADELQRTEIENTVRRARASLTKIRKQQAGGR